MRVAKQTLQETLNSANQYIIPVFQRYYSWERPSWQQLWEDITELQEPDDQGARHFMGTLVFVAEPHATYSVPAYQVVDGQQRLLTLSLLLCAIRDVAISHGFDDLADEITQTFLVHKFKKGREHYRVYPRQRDRDQYLTALHGNTILEVDGKINQAITFFTGTVQGVQGHDTEAGLRAFFDTLQSGLEFVHIILEGENPYQIFKSLNSTGVDLGEGDLIRNFVFMHVPIAEQDGFDDQRWKPLEAHFENASGQLDGKTLSAFFRDFLMRRGRYIGPASTFAHFEKRYTTESLQPHALVDDLARHAGFYDVIRGRRPYGVDAVDDAFAQLRDLDSSTTYPLLLTLMDRVAPDGMAVTDLAHAVELLSSFILRRFVCQESSRQYGRWFVSSCPLVGEDPLASLRTYLIDKGFPDDDRFRADFVRFNRLYQSNYAAPILRALERAYHHKEPSDLSSTQIEHIMPQTLTPTWQADLGGDWQRVHNERLHTLGNLTLSAYNGEVSNKPFVEKRKTYETSNVVITRLVAQYPTWTETQIIERAGTLSELATCIWVGPTT